MMEEEYSPVQMTGQRVNISTILQKVFTMMTLGLLVTGLTSYIVLHNMNLLLFVLKSYVVWIIAELALVIALSLSLKKIGSGTAKIMFYVYAIINGITLSAVVLAYTGGTVASAFFITAGVFATAAIYGKTTKRDLNKMGTYLMMALVGLIIAGIVNIFILNDTLSFIISIVGIIIFVGLTAYDVRKIEEYSQTADENDPESINKVVTIGALNLYLDFINIFLKLLRLMGRRRN